MDKRNKGQVLVVLGALILLLVNNFVLRHKLRSAAGASEDIARDPFPPSPFRMVAWSLRIMEGLKKGASALAFSETKLSFKNGKAHAGCHTGPPRCCQPGSTYYVVSRI